MDAETFIWWIVPLIATIAGALYAARKDLGLEERIRKLELCESHREGRESSGLPEAPEPADASILVHLGGLIATNTQSIATHSDRLDDLEKDE